LKKSVFVLPCKVDGMFAVAQGVKISKR